MANSNVQAGFLLGLDNLEHTLSTILSSIGPSLYMLSGFPSWQTIATYSQAKLPIWCFAVCFFYILLLTRVHPTPIVKKSAGRQPQMPPRAARAPAGPTHTRWLELQIHQLEKTAARHHDDIAHVTIRAQRDREEALEQQSEVHDREMKALRAEYAQMLRQETDHVRGLYDRKTTRMETKFAAELHNIAAKKEHVMKEAVRVLIDQRKGEIEREIRDNAVLEAKKACDAMCTAIEKRYEALAQENKALKEADAKRIEDEEAEALGRLVAEELGRQLREDDETDSSVDDLEKLAGLSSDEEE